MGVSLLVSDLPCELRFRIRGRRIVTGWSPATDPPWDVRIRGTFDDFWLMASGGEDPDTLFFQRRLAIEGDTECGLILKNLLDALEYDWPAHVAAVLGPLALLRPSRPVR
jgi:predicted lipid carrier protein YhbT